jgi:hypothetical protein
MHINMHYKYLYYIFKLLKNLFYINILMFKGKNILINYCELFFIKHKAKY